MSRANFTKPTKRAAWQRAGGRCEASGAIFGMAEDVRCNRDLSLGVEYDHLDPDANSSNASLWNCLALCPACHRYKTTKRDRPLIAKTNHQQDKARGIKQKRPWSKYKRKMDGTVVLRTPVTADMQEEG